MVPPKPFKKYYDGKCSYSNFSMPKAKTISQMTKTKARERLKAKAKAVISEPHLQIVF